VGFRSDLEQAWSFPEATHSREDLAVSQFKTFEYWERHGVPQKMRPKKPPGLFQEDGQPLLFGRERRLPWLTVRDAIADLGEPSQPNEEPMVPNHVLQQGARAYAGHTGSPLDAPAKTLKAGDHGVPGGENMLRYPDGKVRYFTVRESSRLQTFPDGFIFEGSWTENMRQLGNAVPVALAERVLRSVQQALREHAGRKPS